jgi:hypothetical protein
MNATFDDCPLPIKTPEFKYNHHEPASNFVIEFGIGEDDHKTSCQSYIDLNADLGGSYDMELAVKINGRWTRVECQALRVKILGSYERTGFMYALQKAGLMTLPVYGTIEKYWDFGEG